MFVRKLKFSLILFLLASIISSFALFRLFYHTNKVFSATTHVVISQIQAAGAGSGHANEEFVELYNPTGADVDLTSWRIRNVSSSQNLVAGMSGTIGTHKYFLVGSPSYVGLTPDETYSATTSAFTANSTIVLYSDAGTTTVDKVGMGTATDNETSPAPAPTTGGSIQRKLDDTEGHGIDTDNNSADFESLATSDPRNSSSTIVSPIASPTNSPSESPSENPSPTGSPSPSPISSPTSTPSDSPSPTISPTESPSVSPSPTETPSPSESPSIIPSSSPTATPSHSPIPFPSIKPITINTPFFICKLSFLVIDRGFFKFIFPTIVCINKNI